jgi:hypothetical protein
MSGIAAADPVTGHTSVRLAETVVQFDALTEAQISRLAKKNIENAGALAPEDIDQLAHRTELRNASAPDLANPQDGVMARVVEGDADNSVGMPMATVNELLTECGFGKNYSRLQQRENLHNQSPYFRLKGALTPAQADELIDDLLKTGRTTMLLNVWDRLGYNAVDVPGILVFWERVAQRPAPDQESVRRLMASQLMGRGYILNKVNSPSYGSDSAAVIIQSFFPEVSASLKERLAHNMKRWSVEDRIHPPVFSFWRWLLNWHSDAQPAGFRRYYEHQQEIYAAFDILRKQPDLDLWGRLQLCQVVESGMPLGDLPMAGTTLERLALDHQSNFFRDEPEGFWDAFRHTMEERIRPQWTAIRSGGQAPHTLQLAVIGAGLGQEPLSMIAVLENIFDQLGVDRTRLTYTIHVFDRPGPVLDALRENRMLYPQDQLVYWPRKHQHFRGLEKIDAQWKPSAELHDSLRFHALNLYEPSTLEIPPELGHAMEFVSMHAVLQHVTPSNSPQPTRYAEDMLAASSFVRHLLRSDGLLSIGGIGPVHPIASQAFNGMIQTDDGWFIRESDFHKRNRALDLPTTTPTQPPNLPSSGLILRRSAWELFTPQGWLFFKGHVLAWFGRFAGWIFLSNKGQALKERAVFEEAPRREKAYWKPIQEALAQTLQGALGWQIDVDLLKDVEHIIEEITRSGWMIEAIDRGARAFAAPHGDKVIVNGQVIKLTSENRGLYHDQLRELYTHVARRMIEAAAKSFIENSQAGLLKQFSSFVISEALRASDVASVTAHAEINRARYRTGEAVGMIPRIRNLNQAG